MSDAVVQIIDNQVIVVIAGSELLTPLVTAATSAKTAAEAARDDAQTAKTAAEAARDVATDRTAAVLAILGRGDLYSVDLTSQAVAFMAGGVEILPLSNYFRVGGTEDTVLTDLPGLTCTRASTGYARTTSGTFTAFLSNIPRITNKGLLCEPAATNLVPRYGPTTAQLTSATNVSNATEPASPPIAGLQWLTHNNAAGAAFGYQAATLLANTTYTMSCLCETPDGSSPAAGANTASFDFTFLAASAFVTSAARYLRLSGNVWLVAVTFTTAGTIAGTNCGIFRQNLQNTRALKTTGWQLEAGSRVTSPIITTGASATRAGDLIQLTGLTIGEEVTIDAEFSLDGGDSSVTSAGRFLLDLDSGTTANRIYANNISGAVGFTTVVASSTAGAAETAGTLAVDEVVKVCYRSKAADFRMAKGGTLSPADTVGAAPPALTRLTVGGISTGSNQINGFLRALTILPVALSDAQLQTNTL